MINLDKIFLYLFVYIVEAGILWLYIHDVFDLKYSRILKTSLISIGYGILFLLSFANSLLLNTVIFSLINFIILKVLCTAKWRTCFFHALILTTFMGLSEAITFAIFSNFNETYLYTNIHITSLVLLTVSSKSMYFICILMITKWGGLSKDHSEHRNRVTGLLNAIPLILIYIEMVLVSFLLTVAPSTVLRYILFTSSFLLLVINFIIIYIYHYTQKKNEEFIELQLQLQKEYAMAEYNKTLFIHNKNQQILIHDIRKHLTAIAQLNGQNEHEKIQQYLDTLLNSSDLQDSVRVSDNEMLNSIFCQYIKICHDKHIKFRADIRTNLLQKLNFPELTSLFCNLLDNAVEACNDIPNSFIEVSVIRKNNSNLTLISIINTCNNAPSFDDNGFPASSKKDKQKHGLGLKSVNRIANKYNGSIKMYYENQSKTFHTIILLNNA